MINCTSKSFYSIQAGGEAAELISSVFSARTINDIDSIILASTDFDHDISAILEFDASMAFIKEGLDEDIVEKVELNPLYFPSSESDIDEALVPSKSGNEVKFLAMHGNPFLIKSIDISKGNIRFLTGVVSYHKFELPSYEEILKNNKQALVN